MHLCLFIYFIFCLFTQIMEFLYCTYCYIRKAAFGTGSLYQHLFWSKSPLLHLHISPVSEKSSATKTTRYYGSTYCSKVILLSMWWEHGLYCVQQTVADHWVHYVVASSILLAFHFLVLPVLAKTGSACIAEAHIWCTNEDVIIVNALLLFCGIQTFQGFHVLL